MPPSPFPIRIFLSSSHASWVNIKISACLKPVVWGAHLLEHFSCQPWQLLDYFFCSLFRSEWVIRIFMMSSFHALWIFTGCSNDLKGLFQLKLFHNYSCPTCFLRLSSCSLLPCQTILFCLPLKAQKNHNNVCSVSTKADKVCFMASGLTKRSPSGN